MAEVEVEIYLEEDVNEDTLSVPEDIVERTTECLKDIESNLGITMEQSKISKVLEGGIIPFHRMSSDECRYWGAVCPNKHSLDNYRGQIPIRVLEALRLATEKKMFEKYSIYSEVSDIIDPVLVGFIDETGESRPYTKTPYLIARWGESLFSISELKDRALKATVERIKLGAEKSKSEVDSVLSSVESFALAYLRDGSRLPYIRVETPPEVSI
jgi:hypothetical protein